MALVQMEPTQSGEHKGVSVYGCGRLQGFGTEL